MAEPAPPTDDPDVSGKRAKSPEFFVAKDEHEHGPYDDTQILAMLQTGEVTRKDLVYYNGLGEWKAIEDVFDIQEALTHFMDEGQEPEVVVKAYNIIAEMLGGDEEVYYIAHQRKKFLRGNRDVVVVTNRRLIIVKHHLTGHEIEDYLWSNIVSVQTKEGLMGSVFAIRHSNDHVFEVDGIPHAQLARLVQLSQELRG